MHWKAQKEALLNCLRPLIKILSENYLTLNQAIGKSNQIDGLTDDAYILRKVVRDLSKQLNAYA